jgi:hypothetical protein
LIASEQLDEVYWNRNETLFASFAVNEHYRIFKPDVLLTEIAKLLPTHPCASERGKYC